MAEVLAEALQRLVGLVQEPQVLCLALEGVSLDWIVQIHLARTSRREGLDTRDECAVRRQGCLLCPGRHVLCQRLVEDADMLSLGAGRTSR